MKIGIFGTGMVGQALGSKLIKGGHEVMLGSRSKGNEKAVAWAEKAGERASEGTFAQEAAFGDIIMHCGLGTAAVAIVESARQELAGKLLVDMTNPLDFSNGMPPTLFVSGGDDSLGERIQAALPETHVVKAFNMISNSIMIDPGKLDGEHDLLICGNDDGAKAKAKEFLHDAFGWKSFIDLGDVTNARGTEAYLLLWLRLWNALGTPDFNLKIVREPKQ